MPFLDQLLNPDPLAPKPTFGQNFRQNLGPLMMAIGTDIASGGKGRGLAMLPGMIDDRARRQAYMQEQQQQAQARSQTAAWLQPRDPELAQLVQQGAIDSKTAVSEWYKKEQAKRAMPDAPDVVEIFDDQGRPQKAMWNGREYVPVGGSKAPQGPGISIGEDGQLVVNSPQDTKNAANVIMDERALSASATKLKDNIKVMREAQKRAGYTGIGGGVYDAADQVMETVTGGRIGLPGSPAARAVIKSGGLKFVLDNVQATKGAISNKEMDLFAQAAPGLSTTPEGNKVLLDIAEKVADRQIQRAQEMENWRRQNGTVDGFEAAWADYVENNPILTPDMFGVGPAAPAANAPAVSYEEYFK
jgi:hypothetical protein